MYIVVGFGFCYNTHTYYVKSEIKSKVRLFKKTSDIVVAHYKQVLQNYDFNRMWIKYTLAFTHWHTLKI